MFDGAGSDDRDRSAGTAFTTFLRAVDGQPYARGASRTRCRSSASTATWPTRVSGTPAVGHVFSKTGTRAAVEPAGVGLINARTQVGYIDAASGRKLVFSIMVADVPWDPDNIDTLIQVITDVANLTVAIYEAY